MTRGMLQRHTSVLIGIGLVLVGLLVGILLMLWLEREEGSALAATQVVERVELGAPRPAPVATTPDSGARSAVPELESMNRVFREVAGRVTPSVVAIRVQLEASEEAGDWFHNFDEDAQRFFEQHAPRQSVGSGVTISPQGYIVTNHHVVGNARNIHVVLPDKREFEAELVGADPSTDLAVIKVDAPDLTVVPFGDSDKVHVGDWVLAIGNPFRLNSTVTAGIVSALGRQVNIINDELGIEDFIQTDAAINPGNSGGALVNLRGELVGINTAIATESGSYEGYGFAVPSNLMKRVVTDLVAYGEVKRGFLGVEIRPVTQSAARQLGLDRIGGVYLGHVQRGGAADRAGLERGDVVLGIDGQRVDAPNELQSVVARHRPGDALGLTVWRGGREQEMQVELMGRDAPAYKSWLSDLQQGQRRPPDDTDTPSPEQPEADLLELEAWGLGLRDVGEQERRAFDVEQGAYVAYVEHGGLAHAAGLPRDVVIQRINDQQVSTVEEALDVMASEASEGPVLLRVMRRDGRAAFYEVVPEMAG